MLDVGSCATRGRFGPLHAPFLEMQRVIIRHLETPRARPTVAKSHRAIVCHGGKVILIHHLVTKKSNRSTVMIMRMLF